MDADHQLNLNKESNSKLYQSKGKQKSTDEPQTSVF